MRQIRFVVALTAACGLFAAGCVSAADAPNVADVATNAATPANGEPRPDWLTRQSLSGDWGGTRTSLEQQGITVKPRLTQFYQGLTSGEGEHGFEYGSKADVLVTADLHKLGFWDGLSMTVHAEYNFGNSVNGRGGVLIPVNAALNFPGHGRLGRLRLLERLLRPGLRRRRFAGIRQDEHDRRRVRRSPSWAAPASTRSGT